MHSAAEVPQGRASVSPSPSRRPFCSPSPQHTLPSVVTWRVPDIAAVLLLELEPRKLLVQCHYLQTPGDQPGFGGGGTGGKHAVGAGGHDENEEGGWAEEWSFPFVVVPTGRAANAKEMVGMFRKCLGIAVEIVSEVDTRPFQDRRPGGPHGGGCTPCRLYRARVATVMQGAAGVQDMEEHMEEISVAHATQDYVGAEHDLLIQYTRLNPAVDEVGAIEIGQLRALHMSLMHRRCRLACWDAFLSDVACMGGKADVAPAQQDAGLEDNVAAVPWSPKALSAGETRGAADSSASENGKEGRDKVCGDEKTQIASHAGDRAQMHVSKLGAVGGQVRGKGTRGGRGDRDHSGLSRGDRGSQLRRRVERECAWSENGGGSGWGSEDLGRRRGFEGRGWAGRGCEEHERKQATPFLTWIGCCLQQALHEDGTVGEKGEGGDAQQRSEADMELHSAAAYVQVRRQVGLGDGGMESFEACLRRLLEDDVALVATDAPARMDGDGDLANAKDARVVGLVTAAVTRVVRKAVEAGETLFAAVHWHSARPGRVPGERSLEVARDGQVMTSLAANRHLFLRQVCGVNAVCFWCRAVRLVCDMTIDQFVCAHLRLESTTKMTLTPLPLLVSYLDDFRAPTTHCILPNALSHIRRRKRARRQ